MLLFQLLSGYKCCLFAQWLWKKDSLQQLKKKGNKMKCKKCHCKAQYKQKHDKKMLCIFCASTFVTARVTCRQGECFYVHIHTQSAKQFVVTNKIWLLNTMFSFSCNSSHCYFSFIKKMSNSLNFSFTKKMSHLLLYHYIQ